MKFFACLALVIGCCIKSSNCSSDGFIIKHYSGLCLGVHNRTNQIYLKKLCNEKFKWTRENTIMHVDTSLCLIPENGKDNAKIYAKDNCSSVFSQFKLTGNGSLCHVASKKCVHPFWGCPVPLPGEGMVLHRTCGLERLKFDFVTNDTECLPLYPYCHATPPNAAKLSSCSQREIVKGLDWHWVYVILTVATTIIIGQLVFIMCIYLKMAKRLKNQDEVGTIRFRKSSHEYSVPGNASHDVHMISITSTEHDEFSDSSSTSTIEKGATADEGENAKEERTYINIDYNQNKGREKNKSANRRNSKDRNSKRLSKLSVDVSKMRHLFKIRKSYTLNDLEMLKRISIERHEYEEPISPLSLKSQPARSNSEVKGETSGYIEPDTKCVRGRSASVPAKFSKQDDGYLKPIISERDKKKCKGSNSSAYVNLKPSSPTRTEKNLYDMPQMALIEEDGEECLELEAHTYVKILENKPNC